ncbi:MAG TPA: hypothetical protein VME67_20390 [Mycobacterium sp.]|nr:hypothetical protein [Mycobacterium sp.]HTX96988.1 hypothetical protein [Mycobacterium sp.]
MGVVALAATIFVFLTADARLIVFTGVVCVVLAAALRPLSPLPGSYADARSAIPDVGIGTVRTIDGVIEVESVLGETFIGRLRQRPGEPASILRPGLVLLVAFDPATREELSLADDMVAVHAASLKAQRRGSVARRCALCEGTCVSWSPAHRQISCRTSWPS